MTTQAVEATRAAARRAKKRVRSIAMVKAEEVVLEEKVETNGQKCCLLVPVRGAQPSALCSLIIGNPHDQRC